MSSKLLYGLPTTLLANNLIIDTSQIDLNRITHKNAQENKKILSKEDFKKNLEPLNFPDSNLLLPVNVIIFDKYYRRLSEWKYLDKYTFENNILVFDKKLIHSEEYKGSYKKVWLNDLKHLRDFKYYKTNMKQYPYRNDSFNINWIDGKGSGHHLRNILSLSLPQKIEKSFETHNKIVQLNHAFPMDSKIHLYSGYWKNGELNQKNNVISNVEYGNLKLHHKRWNDIYHNFPEEKQTCESLSSKQDKDLKKQKSYISEGFDSKCDQIGLANLQSYFRNNRDKNIYSSGYVGYRNKENSWNKQYFFYSLGEWMLDRPAQYQVNESQESDNKIWYVDFDDIFIPEIKIPEIFNKTKDHTLKLSIYLNYDKINSSLSDFWKISPQLNYKMKFKLNGEDREIKFHIKDILEGKTFDIMSSQNKILDYSFSNFELLVNSDNSKIKLVFNENEKSFKYKLNLSIIKQRFNLFHSIVMDQDELKNYYYSELKNKEKLEKLFYLVSTDKEGNKSKFIKMSKEWLDYLKIKITGNDLSPAASIEYYDFLVEENKKLELSNLQYLPSFLKSEYIRRDKFSSVKEIISSQTNQKIGEFFWNNMDLKLIEKNILDGTEKYVIVPKDINEINREWKEYYKNIQIKVKNSLDKYLIPKTQISNLQEIIKNGNFQELFNVHKPENKKFDIDITDFKFTKIGEKNDYIEAIVEYQKNPSKDIFEQMSEDGEKVNLLGKTKFKINKRDSYMIFPNDSELPFYISTGSEIDQSKSLLDNSIVIPAVVGGVLSGGGLVAGIGAFLSKKLRLLS
ncbi:hypothetical protein [Mycoplasma parvum]|uniref:Uncharacterized protein n=1 Tax=Mycoplasma parvum str. Indiana TaxID=1403316 RepID=U5NCJ3_9MOLU|nr:hypothetical protein [Mycoplasma parvum]AGX89147.1 hypothetical protein PRV_02045 [Mycoplasma parvum str. Indiana]